MNRIKKKRFLKKGKNSNQSLIINKPANKYQDFWALILKILTIIGLVTAPFIAYFTLKDQTRTSHEQYQKDNFDEGDLKGPLVSTDTTSELSLKFQTKAVIDTFPLLKGIYIKNFEQNKSFVVIAGGSIDTINNIDLIRGTNIMSPKGNRLCSDFNVTLGVRNKRIYVSTEFKDFIKEETIGIINYNHWKLYLPNLLDYTESDTSLVVRDKQNYVVFAITYSENRNTIFIAGYFINQEVALVLPNHEAFPDIVPYVCIPRNEIDWKKKVLVEIAKIKEKHIF